jgi:hypothetical protein
MAGWLKKNAPRVRVREASEEVSGLLSVETTVVSVVRANELE